MFLRSIFSWRNANASAASSEEAGKSADGVDDIGSALKIARAERDAYLQQRDVAIGQFNIAAERIARIRHRLDVVSRPVAGTPERLLLFLHLGKTGGVTLSDILMRNITTEDLLKVDMGEVDASPLGIWSELAIEKALARLSASQAGQLRFVWGHFRTGIQAHLPKPCATVTLLRDPVDRVISSYYYNNPTAPRERLQDYLAGLAHRPVLFDNYMTRVLSGSRALDPHEKDATTEHYPLAADADFQSAKRALDDCMVVGTTEQFDEVLLVLSSHLRWTLSDLVYLRRNVTASRPAAAELPQEARRTLLEWNEYDSALFAYARTLLADRIAVYGSHFDRDLDLFRRLNARFQQGTSFDELYRLERSERSAS